MTISHILQHGLLATIPIYAPSSQNCNKYVWFLALLTTIRNAGVWVNGLIAAFRRHDSTVQRAAMTNLELSTTMLDFIPVHSPDHGVKGGVK